MKAIDGLDLQGQKATNAAAPAASTDLLTLGFADGRYATIGGGGGGGGTDTTATHYKGAWQSGTAYAVNDLVTYNSRLYICTAPVTGTTPSQVGKTTGTVAATSVNITLPAGTQAGDLAVLLLGAGNVSTTLTYPTGFLEAAEGNRNPRLGIATKTLTATDITNGYVAQPSQASTIGYTLRVFRGVSSVGPSSWASATQPPALALTASSSGFLITAASDAWMDTGGGTMTASTGTDAVTASTNVIDSVHPSGYASEYASFTGGTYTNPTWSDTNGRGFWTTIALALYTAAFQAANFTEIAAVHDTNGRLQSADPAAATDVSTKNYSDTKMAYKGAWSASSAYALNDVITYSGKLYVCTTAVAASGLSYVGSSSLAGNGALTLPAGCQTGDIVVLGFASYNGVSGVNAPWTTIQNYAPYDNFGLASYTLTATDITNGTTPSTGGLSSATAVVAHVYRRAAVDTSSVAHAQSGTTSSITPANNGVLFEFAGTETSSAMSISGPALGSVTKYDGAHMSAVACYETVTAGVATTSRTVTPAPGTTTVNMVVALYSTTTFPSASFTELAIDSPLNSRATVAATTPSLAAGASDTSTTIALGKSFRLLSIQTSRPARVELYETAAAMTADASRAVGTNPANDASVVLDYVTADTAAHTLSPQVSGSNMESTPTTAISMRVTNQDTVTGTITVTFVAIRTE